MSKHQPGTDDESFLRAIGWRASSASLPDDYEEKLLERIFGDGARLHLEDLADLGGDLAPVSAASPLEPRHTAHDLTIAHDPVHIDPLVETPPVSPKLSWRPSRRMTVVLAAAAAVALVGTAQLPEEGSRVLPVAAPKRLVPQRLLPITPEPDHVRRLPFETPRQASCDGPDELCARNEDADQPPETEAEAPDPGATRFAQRQAEPTSVTARDSVPEGATGVSLASLDTGLAMGTADPQAWAWTGLELGPPMRGLAAHAFDPNSFDPDGCDADVAATASLDDDMAVPVAVATGGPDAPALIPTTDPRPMPVVATLATHNLGPRWLGLGVSMPRDVQASAPAGIRVVGAIDISKTHRHLQF